MALTARNKWILLLVCSAPFVGWRLVQDYNMDLRLEATEYMWKSIYNKKYSDVTNFVKSANAVNDRHAYGVTPLIYAVQHNDPKMVETLLRLKADSRCRTEDGKTAWDVAKEMKRKDIMALLQQGASARLPLRRQ